MGDRDASQHLAIAVPRTIWRYDSSAMAVNKVLDEIYRTGTVITADGERPAASVVVQEFAEALYRVVRNHRPKRVLEVGMANGVTTLAIAQGLHDNGDGEVTSVDPFQSSHWRSGGLITLERAGLSARHRLVEEPDYVALPRFLDSGARFDLVYIDGLHSLEYVVIDFFYSDRMLGPGGIIGFNDCDWPTVIPTLRLLERYRRYEQLNVGLPAIFEPSNRLSRKVAGKIGPAALRRPLGPLMGRRKEDRYYRKLEDWEPPEGFYRPIAGRAHPRARF